MTSFPFGQLIKGGTLIPAQAWNGGDDLTTANALALDTSGAEGVAVVVTTGAVVAGAAITIKFHEVPLATTAPAEANEIPEARIQVSPDMDATDNACYVHAIKTNGKFLKVVVSRGGTDAAALAVTGILGLLAKQPAE